MDVSTALLEGGGKYIGEFSLASSSCVCKLDEAIMWGVQSSSYIIIIVFIIIENAIL